MTRLRPELLDELLADYETPEDLLGEEGFQTTEKRRFWSGRSALS